MSESVRFYRYQTLLSARRAVPAQEFLDTLEISLATFKRDIAKMRDQLGMPIVFDRDRKGYVLEAGHSTHLPGLWFTPQELVALATLQQLLVQLHQLLNHLLQLLMQYYLFLLQKVQVEVIELFLVLLVSFFQIVLLLFFFALPYIPQKLRLHPLRRQH